MITQEFHNFQTDYFHLWFLFKNELAISTAKNVLELLESNAVNDTIYHIIDQKKVSRVPLCIERCPLCMEGYFKLRLHVPTKQSYVIFFFGGGGGKGLQ